MNYSELKTEVADLLDHNDSDPKIDRWIDMAEAMINRELRSREMTCKATAAGDGSTTEFDLPADWGGARLIKADGRDLKYRTPEQITDLEASQNRPSPARYTLIGSKLIIYPAPAAPAAGTKNVIMYYYQKVPALSDENPTNWLLSENPDCYLWLTVAHGHRHVMDEARADYYQGLGLGVIDSLENQTWQDMWSGGVSAATPDFYVP